MTNIVVLTGAGVSAESGISTFRDTNGLWEKYNIEDVASPEGFENHPSIVHRFYNIRRAQLKQVQPSAAHIALAELEQAWHKKGDFMLITQNVDDLHKRAGSQRLIHMHGELLKIRCKFCQGIFHHEEDLSTEARCVSCAQSGGLRPDIVWFGEEPYGMEQAYSALEKADIFVAIGTSGQVYPAAGFVGFVHQNGRSAKTLEINPNPTYESHFNQLIQEKAATGILKLASILTVK